LTWDLVIRAAEGVTLWLLSIPTVDFALVKRCETPTLPLTAAVTSLV
jgi:hypothetical protein